MQNQQVGARELLTDVEALTRNRARAATNAIPPFLHELAASEVHDKLQEINRSFQRIAIVSGRPEFWRKQWPMADLAADSDTINFESAPYDLILHAMSLHWSNDPVGQLIQCRLALKPDGLLIACLPGGETLNELRFALTAAELALTGGASPRVIPMGDIRDLGGLLQRAGLALPVADRVRTTCSYASALDLMRDLRAMGEANAMTARSRRFAPRRLFEEAELQYRSQHKMPDGRLPATFDLIFLTGWAPSDTQQRPLRPGSAVKRLADALSTIERKP